MFQEREVFTMHVQGTRKNSKKDQTAGSKIIVDNCPAHPHVPDLMAIDLIFSSPNTISAIQPMNQAVIRSLKAKYRAKVIHQNINAMESNNELPKITILDTLAMLEQS